MYAIKENAEGLRGGTGKGGELKLAASFFVFFFSVSYRFHMDMINSPHKKSRRLKICHI